MRPFQGAFFFFFFGLLITCRLEKTFCLFQVSFLFRRRRRRRRRKNNDNNNLWL